MKRRKGKPTLFDSAAKGDAWEPSPEENLRLCILYLVTFEGSSLDELAEAAGLDVDLVDRYMVGQEPVSRQLVERFCKIAGTTLPRVELALPTLHWTFRLMASKKIPPLSEIEREGQIQRNALRFALLVFDGVLHGLTEGLADPLEPGELGTLTLGAPFCESMALAFGNIAGEAFRQGARAGMRAGQPTSLRDDESEDADSNLGLGDDESET